MNFFPQNTGESSKEKFMFFFVSPASGILWYEDWEMSTQCRYPPDQP